MSKQVLYGTFALLSRADSSKKWRLAQSFLLLFFFQLVDLDLITNSMILRLLHETDEIYIATF